MKKSNNANICLAILQPLAVLVLILSGFAVLGQNNTESDTTISKQDTILKYITPLDYAFMMHEETSWLLKGGIIFENPFNGRITFKLGFEKRIAKSFTLNLLVNNIVYEEIPDYPYPIKGGIQSSLESRWYYRLNNRIKKNEVAKNMSDNYFAFGLGYTHLFLNNNLETSEELDNKSISLFLKWGVQRRFLKWGHADIGIKAGLSNNLNNYFSPSFLFTTYVDLGLGITKDKYKLNREKLCPVLKCFEAENYAFKSNLSSLFTFSFYKQGLHLSLAPHIAYERKIGKSPFSINTELLVIFGYEKFNIDYQENTYKGDNFHWRSSLDLEGRWYYNLKRRILKGKTGNGLSASYLAAGGRYTYYKSSKYAEGSFTPSVYVVTGWQRLFSEHMYYDINVGLEYDADVYDYIIGVFQFALGYKF